LFNIVVTRNNNVSPLNLALFFFLDHAIFLHQDQSPNKYGDTVIIDGKMFNLRRTYEEPAHKPCTNKIYDIDDNYQVQNFCDNIVEIDNNIYLLEIAVVVYEPYIIKSTEINNNHKYVIGNIKHHKKRTIFIILGCAIYDHVG
jgi:hypothetical protein